MIPLQKIRAPVFKPDNKDYYQTLGISSFHSYWEWDDSDQTESCSGISFHSHLSTLQWHLRHDLALLGSSHVMPLWWRFLFHQKHISLTTGGDNGTPATNVVLPAVLTNMMWLKHTVACWMLNDTLASMCLKSLVTNLTIVWWVKTQILNIY